MSDSIESTGEPSYEQLTQQLEATQQQLTATQQRLARTQQQLVAARDQVSQLAASLANETQLREHFETTAEKLGGDLKRMKGVALLGSLGAFAAGAAIAA